VCGGCALFGVIIIHDETGVYYTWDPTQQSQNEAQEKTGDASRQQYRKRRQNNAEKISERFHHELLLFRFLG
jgi:hypothetical protein